MRREEYNDKKLFNLLKILTVKKRAPQTNTKIITTENLIEVVKKAKKRSVSSIFLKRTYATHKYALGLERMMDVLVVYNNIIIQNEYYPKRLLKYLMQCLEKEKEWLLENYE